MIARVFQRTWWGLISRFHRYVCCVCFPPVQPTPSKLLFFETKMFIFFTNKDQRELPLLGRWTYFFLPLPQGQLKTLDIRCKTSIRRLWKVEWRSVCAGDRRTQRTAQWQAEFSCCCTYPRLSAEEATTWRCQQTQTKRLQQSLASLAKYRGSQARRSTRRK